MFITWVRECVTTPKFSINLNGELVGFFGSSRGLRQGDPISAYLFVIVMEVLSMIIRYKVEQSVLEGRPFQYHWHCSKTRITHLCFADDLMLFCGESYHSAQLLHEALMEFSFLSGLFPNYGKSCIFLAGRNIQYNNMILNLF